MIVIVDEAPAKAERHTFFIGKDADTLDLRKSHFASETKDGWKSKAKIAIA